jgi:hypothetical protein
LIGDVLGLFIGAFVAASDGSISAFWDALVAFGARLVHSSERKVTKKIKRSRTIEPAPPYKSK